MTASKTDLANAQANLARYVPLQKNGYATDQQVGDQAAAVAEVFNDLDGSMDSRADDFEKKADDPKFLGFHRLEKALFADKDLKGMEPVADKLMADVKVVHADRIAHWQVAGCRRRRGSPQPEGRSRLSESISTMQ